MNLKNKVALVTGGSKGIGFGVAQSLLQQGIHVAITSRSSTDASEAADLLNTKNNTEASLPKHRNTATMCRML